MSEHEHRANPNPEQSENKEVLTVLSQKLLSPGTLFGSKYDTDVELSDTETQELMKAIQEAEKMLEPMYRDERWITLQKLIEEGNSKGLLSAFINHEGTFVPTWLVNGGDFAELKKIRIVDRENSPGIQVPEDIFHLYDYTAALKTLRDLLSPEKIKGRMTLIYGRALQYLTTLLTSTEAQR